MVMLVLIAPDKFKGTLDASEAAKAIARGWLNQRPNDQVDIFPISDGGDGFGELLGKHLGAETRSAHTVNAAGRPIKAPWWWVPRLKLAIVESAKIIGLAQLQTGKFHPFDLDTRGLATVLREVEKIRPRQCLVGIGGSATNDAGFGMAVGLGWRFLDGQARPIRSWTALDTLQAVEPPKEELRLGRLTVAVDVRNPLLGPRGATRIYGPQKGIRPEDFEPTERCIRKLVAVLADLSPQYRKLSLAAGAGAAGGLGFGFRAFLGGKLEPGFALFAKFTGLAKHIKQADLVITGEGAIDNTTLLMGKGVGQVARLARRFCRPCLGLAGIVSSPRTSTALFAGLFAIVPALASQEEAMAKPRQWLTRLASQAAREWCPE